MPILMTYIASSDMDKHKQHLQLVFQHFKEYGVVINPSKCEQGVTELTFLGHTLNSQGVCPVQEKVTAIQEFLLPSTKRKLKELLGLVNFYHLFIPHCAYVLQPINKLLTATHAEKSLQWDEQSSQAFLTIK